MKKRHHVLLFLVTLSALTFVDRIVIAGMPALSSILFPAINPGRPLVPDGAEVSAAPSETR